MRGLRRSAEACLAARWMRPLTRLLAQRYRGSSTSLLYHRIVAGDVQPSRLRTSAFQPNLPLSVAERRFELQMRELAERHRAIPLQQAVDELEAGADLPASVTLSFDDGYLDNLELALPILERYAIPATICITTGLIDRGVDPWWDALEALLRQDRDLRFRWVGRPWHFPLQGDAAKWAAFRALLAEFKRLSGPGQTELLATIRSASPADAPARVGILSWDQVRELDRHPLITIAAHSVDHPPLRWLDSAAAARELRESRRRLQQQLGHRVAGFAYPFGGTQDASSREFRLCEAEGFAFALTTCTGQWQPIHRQQRFALPRIMVEYADTLEDFRFKLSGLDSMLRLRGRRSAVA